MSKKNNGTFTISQKAFNDIANIACSHINNIYPVKKDDDFAECKFNKEKELTVEVALRVKQGIDIVKVCNKIQTEIKDNIYIMTGEEVKSVNIDIQGFEKN